MVRRELALDPGVEVEEEEAVGADGAGEDAGSGEPRVVASEGAGDGRGSAGVVIFVVLGASAASDAGKEALGKCLFLFFEVFSPRVLVESELKNSLSLSLSLPLPTTFNSFLSPFLLPPNNKRSVISCRKNNKMKVQCRAD